MKDIFNVFFLVDYWAASSAKLKLLHTLARKLADGFWKKGESDKGKNVEGLFCNRTNTWRCI